MEYVTEKLKVVEVACLYYTIEYRMRNCGSNPETAYTCISWKQPDELVTHKVNIQYLIFARYNLYFLFLLYFNIANFYLLQFVFVRLKLSRVFIKYFTFFFFSFLLCHVYIFNFRHFLYKSYIKFFLQIDAREGMESYFKWSTSIE